MEIKYCKKCVTPNTRPRIEFNEEGICNACLYAERKKIIDWKAKEEELIARVNIFKSNTNYDCIVAVSGGKDSHFQVYYTKEVLGLDPLCVTFIPSIPNEIGKKNLRNLIEKLGIDHIAITPNPEVHRKLCRVMFLEHGNQFIPWVQGIFSAVMQIAVEKNIPTILYGENGEAEYGGLTEGVGAKNETSEDLSVRLKSGRPNFKLPNKWHEYGFSAKELIPYIEPSEEEQKRVGIQRIYIGDYYPWSTKYNYEIVEKIGGFTMRETRSLGSYTRGAIIDDDIDEVYMWMLWPKFGFGRASKSASPDIREGAITREQAIKHVKKYDGEFPWQTFDKLLDYLMLTEDEFWSTVAKFVGDKENIQRERNTALKLGYNPDDLPLKFPVWERIGENKWRHLGTIHGEERILEIPIKRP
ncbi:hypothetical protein LCGC14_0985700 [marine sediment metagenome]|uniref:N-acetyl sugar amidotransferase n=1 Tax=marine sediment metagenome TaxID=412755 RepID=A0A0F9N7B5_9ZZZZ|nr:N-acetyl sugar amidotransferase [archaeon]